MENELFVVLQNWKICQVISQKGVIAAVQVLALFLYLVSQSKNAMNAEF